MLKRIAQGLGGSATQALAQFTIMWAIARFGGLAAVGYYAFALAIVGPLALLASFGLRHIAATDYEGEYQAQVYVRARLIGSSLLIALVLTAGLLLSESELWAICIAVAVAKAVELGAELSLAFRYRAGQIGRANIVLSARVVTGAASLLITLWVTGELLYAVTSLCLGWLLIHGLFDRGTYRGNSAGRPRGLWELMRRGALLSASLALASLVVNIPRLVLGATQGEQALGSFAILAYLVSAGGLLINSVAQVQAPRYAKLKAEGQKHAFNREIARSYAILISSALLAAPLVFYAGPGALEMIYGAEIARAASPYLAWSIGAAIFTYLSSLNNSALMGLRAYNPYMMITVVALVAATALSFLLIPNGRPDSVYWVWLSITFSQFATGQIVLVRTLRNTQWES